MKKTQLMVAISLMAAGPAFANTFVNGGFESGNLNGWTGGGGSWGAYGSYAVPIALPYTGGALPTASDYIGGTPNNYIMNGGVDPYTNANRVYSGNYSARLNDNNNNYSVSTLRQSVSNYTDKNIYFAWNAVLQSSHGLTNSDYFSLTLKDDTTGATLVNRSYSSAGSIGAGTTGVTWTPYATGPYGSTVFSSGWVVENINLATAGPGGTSIVGDSFTLTMLASDCPYGGHFGYAYLDGFGSVVPTVPEPSTYALLGMGIGMISLVSIRRRRQMV